MIEFQDTVVRLLLAGTLGAAVGLEREINGQVAGLRTHALVACGAALFTIVGAYGFRDGFGHASIDPTRVSAQVVSGIGFIGGGAILRDRGSLRGVTTAAALWTSAALGMACGAGALTAALAGLVVVLLVLVGLRLARDRGLQRLTGLRESLEVTYERGYGTLGPIIAAVDATGCTLEGIHIEDRGTSRVVRLDVRTRRGDLFRREVRLLAQRSEVAGVVFLGRG